MHDLPRFTMAKVGCILPRNGNSDVLILGDGVPKHLNGPFPQHTNDSSCPSPIKKGSLSYAKQVPRKERSMAPLALIMLAHQKGLPQGLCRDWRNAKITACCFVTSTTHFPWRKRTLWSASWVSQLRRKPNFCTKQWVKDLHPFAVCRVIMNSLFVSLLYN